jgi:hypothetical protein
MNVREEILNTIAKYENIGNEVNDLQKDLVTYYALTELTKNKILMSPKAKDKYRRLQSIFTKKYTGWDITRSKFISYFLQILEDAQEKVKDTKTKEEKRINNEVAKLMMELILLNRINLKSSYASDKNQQQLQQGIEYYINLLNLEFDTDEDNSDNKQETTCNQKASVYSPLSIEKCNNKDITEIFSETPSVTPSPEWRLGDAATETETTSQIANVLQILTSFSVPKDTTLKKNGFGFNALLLLLEMLVNLSRNTATDKASQKQNTMALFMDILKSIQADKRPEAEKALSSNNLVKFAEVLAKFGQPSQKQSSTSMIVPLLETFHKLGQQSKITGGNNDEEHDELYINDANYIKIRKFANDFQNYKIRIDELEKRYSSIQTDYEKHSKDPQKPKTPKEELEMKKNKLKKIEDELITLNQNTSKSSEIKQLQEEKTRLEKYINDNDNQEDNTNRAIDFNNNNTPQTGFKDGNMRYVGNSEPDEWNNNINKQMKELIEIQGQELDALEKECKKIDTLAEALYRDNIKVTLKDFKKFIEELNKSQVLPYDDDVRRTIKELNLLLEFFSESNTNFGIYVEFTKFRLELTKLETEIKKAKKNKDVKIEALKNDINEVRELKRLKADRRQNVVGIPISPDTGRFSGGTYETSFNNFKKLNDKIILLKTLLKEFNDTSGNKSIATTLKVPSLYEDIWDEYVKLNRYAKTNGNLPIYADDMLYNKIKLHNLDPAVVLNLNFSDRIIFIITMFFIRLIIVIFIELLIDYNILRNLEYAILSYAIFYIIFIIILILVINFDAYKLRILINYLNMHVNSTKIFLHILLFIIFMVLVYIMIKSNDSLNTFGDLFDFTHIYKHLYEITETSRTNSENKLSQEEKLKLQYRVDIITMIVFIFTTFLVLVI